MVVTEGFRSASQKTSLQTTIPLLRRGAAGWLVMMVAVFPKIFVSGGMQNSSKILLERDHYNSQREYLIIIQERNNLEFNHFIIGL